MNTRHYGTPVHIDLVVAPGTGTKSVALASQVATQQTTFQLPSDAKLNPNGDWACGPGFWFKFATQVNQGGAGSPLNPDDLARIVASFKVNDPDCFGVLMDDQVYTGPNTKNMIEFINNGCKNAAWDRMQIPITSGNTTIVLYFFLAFGTDNNDDGPEMFFHWLGWHKNTVITITLAGNTALAAASTGASTNTATTVTGWAPAYSLRRPVLPTLAIWKRYLSPAATGANVITVKNLGDAGSARNVSKQVRIAGIFELSSLVGLSGVTADMSTILSFWSDQLNQPRVDNIDSLVTEFRRMIGHRGPITSGTIGQAAHDGGGFPYTQSTQLNGAAQVATLLALPVRYSSPEQRMENLMRWPAPADLVYYRDQPAGGPGAGLNNYILTQEMHEITASGIAILFKKAGIPMTTPIIPVHRRFRNAEQAFGCGKVIRTE